MCVRVVRTDEAVFIIEISASVLTVSASDDVRDERGCDLDATSVDISFLFTSRHIVYVSVCVLL